MAKIRSFGSKLYLDGIAVGGLTDISIASGDVTNVDVTDHSESSGFRTFVAGLKDGGSVELTGKYNYADAGQEDWREAMGDTATVYIILPDNSGFAFNVIVGSFNATAPLDDAAEFTASAKITGEVFPVYPTMTVTGALTDGTNPVIFPALLFVGFAAGKIAYSSNGLLPGGVTGYYAYYDNAWIIDKNTGAVVNARWTAQGNTLTPDEATGWSPQTTSTGTPTVTGS